MIDAAIVQEIAAFVYDAGGAQKPMPTEVRDAIAAEADDEADAATLALWTFRESGWNPKARGDCYRWKLRPDGSKGECLAWRSKGLGQTPWGRTPDDAVGQVRLIKIIMRQSREVAEMRGSVCSQEPLAPYAGGCASERARKIARVRAKDVAEIEIRLRDERVIAMIPREMPALNW